MKLRAALFGTVLIVLCIASTAFAYDFCGASIRVNGCSLARNTGVPYDCFEGHDPNGKDLCCARHVCACGIQVPQGYGVHSRNECSCVRSWVWRWFGNLIMDPRCIDK